MKKTAILVAAAALGITGAMTLGGKFAARSVESFEMPQHPSKGRSLASLPSPQEKAGAPVPRPLLASQALSAPANEPDLSFFHSKLMDNRAVSDYYNKLKERLPASKSTDLIAMYIAEGIARENTAEFAAFMQNLHAAINSDPQSIAKAILDNQSVLQAGPLTYQMTLNLANVLNVSTDQKAQLLGQALGMNIRFDESGQIDALSANVLTAFILMSNAGVSSAQAAPFINQGVKANEGNPAALNAFIDRAHAYYPDVI